MATTKKTKKTAAKRYITKTEHKSIMASYWRLKNKAADLAKSGKLTTTAEKELRNFVRLLEKANDGVNWEKASNYAVR